MESTKSDGHEGKREIQHQADVELQVFLQEQNEQQPQDDAAEIPDLQGFYSGRFSSEAAGAARSHR
jgi:hypothetical protein